MMDPIAPRKLKSKASSRAWALAVVAAVGCGGPEAVQQDASSITGGMPAEPGENPWQVTIRAGDAYSPSGQRHACSGAILNERWIVAVAGCFNPRPEYLWVAAGVDNQKDAGIAGQRREIDRIIVHEDYVGRAKGGRYAWGEYDIALVRLLSPLDLSQPNVAAIERVTAEEDGALTTPGTLATVAGWGALNKGDIGTVDNLHQMTLPIVSNEVAEDAYPLAWVTPKQLAAGLVGVGGKDFCWGDAASPLVIRHPDTGQAKLAGLASWGYKECGDAHHPGMYSRVSAYQAWINAHIAEKPEPKNWLEFTSHAAEDYVRSSTISPSTVFEVAARDGRPLSRVEFHLPNGVTIDHAAPYQVHWNSLSVMDGKYIITAKAFDTEGNFTGSQALPVHVANRQALRGTRILYPFESKRPRWSRRGPKGVLDQVSRVSPRRGNGALRLRTASFEEPLKLIPDNARGNSYGWDSLFGQYEQLRMWVKHEGRASVEFRIILTDSDYEQWRSKHSVMLTDAYKVFRVGLRQEEFELVDGEDIFLPPEGHQGNKKLDLDRVVIQLRFENTTPEKNGSMAVSVDDIVLDPQTKIKPVAPEHVLFDFEADDDKWLAFGYEAPSVDASKPVVTGAENRVLEYTNPRLTGTGGVVRPLEETVDLSRMDEIVFDAHGYVERVGFGFHDADGEVWTSAKQIDLAQNPFLGQVKLSLRPEDFVLVDTVPGNGTPRNARPDLEKVAAYSFVVSTPAVRNARLLIDNVFVRSSDPSVYEDGEDRTTLRWRIYDNRNDSAQIGNVYDADRDSQVIELSAGESNPIQSGYVLRREDGTLWDNSSQLAIEWSMKLLSKGFFIYVDVETTSGRKYIYYSNAEPGAQNSNSRYIHVGLGPMETASWHTITRNLQADLQTDSENADDTVLSVKQFFVRGALSLDDIKLVTAPGDTESDR